MSFKLWLIGHESEIDEKYDKSLVFYQEKTGNIYAYSGSIDVDGLETLEENGYVIIEDNRGFFRRLLDGNSH